MALMERVATLLRANLNDLMDRAEDPEKMLKQLVLDMENQLLQLKTQVAVALTDQHLLEKKAREQEAATAEWHRKAELAVSKGDDALARAALERAITQERTSLAFQAQVTEQATESEALRGTYARLQGKLVETRAQCEILLAQHRRARMVSRATEAMTAVEEGVAGAKREPIVQRVQARIGGIEAQNLRLSRCCRRGRAGRVRRIMRRMCRIRHWRIVSGRWSRTTAWSRCWRS